MNTTSHTDPDVTKEKKGRWRMSGLLGKDKHRDQIIEEETTTLPTHSVHPAERPDLKTTESANRDSAYGSSSNHTSSSLGLPTISKEQMAEQDAPVRIQMDKGTGRRVVCVTTTTRTEVFDADTGMPAEVPAGKDVVVRKTETDFTPAAPQDLGATRVESAAAPSIPVRASKRNSFEGASRPRMSEERTAGPPVREDYEPLSTTTTPSRHLNNTNFSRPHSSLAHPNEGVNNGGYIAPHQQPQHPGYNTTNPLSHNNVPSTTNYNNTASGHSTTNPAGHHNVPSATGFNHTAPEHSNTGINYNNTTGYNNTPAHNNAPAYSSAPGYNNTTDYNNGQPGLARATHSDEPLDRVTSPYSGSVKRRPLPGADGQPIERMGTMASLKAAAAGIHGAGETLRGAINSKVERGTGGSAEAIAAHEAVTQRGLNEINTGKLYHANRHPTTAHELHNTSATGYNAGATSMAPGGTGSSVPITGGNNIPAGSAYETEGYAPSPLVTQAQQGYQDNVPYLPDPLGEAPPNMASSLGYANRSPANAHDNAAHPFPHPPSHQSYPYNSETYGHSRFTEADDSPVSPIDEHGYSGDNSNVGTVTPGGINAPLYGDPPVATKKGRVRNLLRKKSVRS